MSYAGPATPRGRKRAAATLTSRHSTDWQQLAIFGAGLALGISLGAGVALLTAPQAGWKTRSDIKRYTRNKRRALQRRSHDAWADLRDELRDAARALRRRKFRANARPQSPDALHPDTDDR